jgi:SsrA-binding protein
MPSNKSLATNKQVRSDYSILETYEAGIKLTGPEVKSTKAGRVNLKASYVIIGSDLSPHIVGCHIAKYKPSASVQQDYDPTRTRVLLLNKKQIKSLYGKLKEKRLSLVPLSVYSSSGIIKFELGLVKGKRQYEKRDSIKKRDMERDIGRRLKN